MRRTAALNEIPDTSIQKLLASRKFSMLRELPPIVWTGFDLK
jgi:hypothetical protein